MLKEIAQTIQDTGVAQWIATSDVAFPWLETLHVICITTMVGAITVLDLRLLYVAWRGRSVKTVSAEVLPFTWIAFVLAATTGGLLFTSRAVQYVNDWPFRIKMCLIACAAVNMLIFHFTVYSKVDEWDVGRAPPLPARVAAGLSLTFWATVIVFGRWIGFSIG